MYKKSLAILALGLINASLSAAPNVDSTKSKDIQVNVQKQGSNQGSYQGQTSTAPRYSGTGDQTENQRIVLEIQNRLKDTYRNYNVNIRIVDGVVYLTGFASSQEDKKGIEDMVSKINGVKQVKNDVQIKGENPQPR